MSDPNISEELARLARLKDQGVLSEAEFTAQKERLLAGGGTTSETKKSSPLKISGVGCLVAIVVLVLIGIAVGGGETATDNQAAAASAPAEPPLQVTARELFAAYDANEAAAQAKYGNRALLVTGTVDGVDLDFTDKPVVKLRTQNEFMSAQAALVEASHAKATSLSKGQSVTLSCVSVGEVMGTPMLRDCTIQ